MFHIKAPQRLRVGFRHIFVRTYWMCICSLILSLGSLPSNDTRLFPTICPYKRSASEPIAVIPARRTIMLNPRILIGALMALGLAAPVSAGDGPDPNKVVEVQ